MKWTHLIGTCIVLASITPALAQSGVIPPPNLTAPPPDRPIPEAPIGHRQPRAAELPPQNPNNVENPQDANSREDAALDRKIKGICRGC